jgi:hypothetical protein
MVKRRKLLVAESIVAPTQDLYWYVINLEDASCHMIASMRNLVIPALNETDSRTGLSSSLKMLTIIRGYLCKRFATLEGSSDHGTIKIGTCRERGAMQHILCRNQDHRQACRHHRLVEQAPI